MKVFLTILGLMLSAYTAQAADKPLKKTAPKLNQIQQRRLILDALKKQSPQYNLEVAKGGATSGGGDEVGLEVKKSLTLVSQMIASDQGQLYSSTIKEDLLTIAAHAKIIITDEPLTLSVEDTTQSGVALSSLNELGVHIQIQRQRWMAINEPALKDTLLHHELAVLAGIESTGNYHYSDQFRQMRNQFWEKIRARGFVCTVSVFAQRILPNWIIAGASTGGTVIGKQLGSAGIVLTGGGNTTSSFEVIADLSPQQDGVANPALIVRYVISSDGYLRAIFSEANVTRYKNSDWKIFADLSNNSDEITFYSPYDYVDRGREAQLQKWNNYFVQVSCSKL